MPALNDVKSIIKKTVSPLQKAAENCVEKHAEVLPEKIRIIRGMNLFRDLTTRNDEDFRLGMGFALKNFSTGQIDWPSLSSLTIMAAEKFGIDFESSEMKAMLVSATLGEIPNDAEYHNNAHYRKVLLSTIRQISIHNEIYRDTKWELRTRDIALMITAANIHDFMHDGNETGEVPMRLEKQSIELARPFLEEAGVGDGFIADLEVMVLSTYVRPFGNPEAPVNQMKSAYKHYFHTVDEKPRAEIGDKPVLCDELSRLHYNPRLCLLSALFQETDLMPSSVYGYWQAKFEHIAFCREEGLTPSPQGQIGFMKSVADEFLTKAGQANNNLFQFTLKAFENDAADGVEYTESSKSKIFSNFLRCFIPT